MLREVPPIPRALTESRLRRSVPLLDGPPLSCTALAWECPRCGSVSWMPAGTPRCPRCAFWDTAS
jgi:hypothetical protein